jgi:hypothetical protein
MPDSPRRMCWSVLFLSFAAAAGCSRAPSYQLAEVEGVVKFKGKPVPNVRVEFLPDVKGLVEVPRSTATTDKEGRFRLMTDDQRPGAVVGPHRVVVSDPEIYGNIKSIREMESKDFKFKPSRIPSHLSDAAKTPLRQEVKPEKQTIVLNLSTQ